MNAPSIRRALISVYDKTDVADFARALSDGGVAILSTGGTARLLTEAGIPVTLIETVTGAAEMLDGRVKTLHPSVHGGILADRDKADHMGQLRERDIEPIDMVVVDLYPFERTAARPDCTLAEAVEMIDIGGLCLLRAAAKNHAHVAVVPGRQWFAEVLAAWRSAEGIDASLRGRLAAAALAMTSAYDAAIVRHLPRWTQGAGVAFPPSSLHIVAEQPQSLRCGENPHQQAALYRHVDGCDLGDRWSIQTNAERMSFNNHVDATAAYELVRDLAGAAREVPPRLARCAAAFIKHTNPCGAAVADDPLEAYRKAYLGDPLAAMGGVLAMSSPVTVDIAEAVMHSLTRWGQAAGAGAFFVEVWVAPAFEAGVIECIQTSKPWGNAVRLIAAPISERADIETAWDCKRLAGGLLAQTRDERTLDEGSWTIATKRAPSEQELSDLRLAWLVCKHTKSNAITIAREGMLLGTGAGQMSRVTSCRVAAELAGRHLTNRGGTDATPVAASDAFFPFADGPRLLADTGATAIIQPGGSKRDAETIALCDERDLAMVLTGTRHFRH